MHPNPFHRVMDTVPVGSRQVVQEPDRLRVLVAQPRDGFAEPAMVERLQQALATHGAVVPVVVEQVATIPRAPNGKAPLIKAAR